MTYAYIVAGAVVGAPLRYFVGSRVHTTLFAPFPFGTMIVNITGCLAIGLILGLAESRDVIGREARVLLVTGFLGSYTTFSAFGFETYDLVRANEVPRALIYSVGSVTAGVLAAWAGASVGRIGT